MKSLRRERPWTPFEQAIAVPLSEAQLADHARAGGVSIERIRQIEIENVAMHTIWKNSRYQVAMREDRGVVHLSIKRLDKAPITDWRDFQRIKNELVGPENEGLELYPAESRRVDMANQYHLWIMADPQARLPWGFFDGRLVTSDEAGGSKQRALPEPIRLCPTCQEPLEDAFDHCYACGWKKDQEVEALRSLLEWAAGMGGFEAPAWAEARRIVRGTQPTDPGASAACSTCGAEMDPEDSACPECGGPSIDVKAADDADRGEAAMLAGMEGGVEAYNEAMGYDVGGPPFCDRCHGYHFSRGCPEDEPEPEPPEV